MALSSIILRCIFWSSPASHRSVESRRTKGLVGGFWLLVMAGLAGCSDTLPKGEVTRAPSSIPVQSQNVAGNLASMVQQTEFARLIRESVATAPSTAAGVASLAASRSRISAEKGAFLPQLNAETSLTSHGDTVPILRLSQIIYDGGKISARVGLRRVEAEQAWLTEISELSALSFQAVETVIDLDRNRRLESQARQNLQRTTELVEDLQARHDAGAGSVADLLTGQARQSNAETELAQAQTEVALASANWVEVFNAPPGQTPVIPPAPGLAQNISATLIDSSPRLRTQIAASKLREQEVLVAERATRPTLSAILETDFDQGSMRDGAQARLGVDVPIYQGGTARANIETARANLRQSQADEDALRRELQRSLTRALEETNSVQQRLATARSAVKISEDALKAAQSQFGIGRSTLLQILDALRELNTAQVRVIQLEAQARRAEYAVLAVTGDILEALGVSMPQDPSL